MIHLRGRNAGLFLALLSALFAAAATPAAKALLTRIDPLPLAGWFYAGSALGVLPGALLAARRRGRWHVSARNRWRLAGAAVCGGVLGPVAVLLALRLSSAVSVSLWLNLEAVATVLLGHLIFRDRLGRFAALGACGVVVASVLLTERAGFTSAGSVGLVAIACIFWGIDNHLTALIDDLSPEEVTLVKSVAAVGINAGGAALLGQRFVGGGGPAPVLLGLLVGIAAYGWSIALYIRSARELGATRAHLVFATSPFLAALLSVLLLRESFEWTHAAALPLLVLSLALLFADRHDHLHAHEAMEHEHSHRHDDGHHTHVHPGLLPSTRHTHRHRHEPIVHRHPHRPDLHHRHAHDMLDDKHGPEKEPH